MRKQAADDLRRHVNGRLGCCHRQKLLGPDIQENAENC